MGIRNVTPEPKNPHVHLTDESPTYPFFVNGGEFIVLCDTFVGANAWKLQVKSPTSDTLWIDTGLEFTAIGHMTHTFSPLLMYRFFGGDTGAQIWVVNTYAGGVL